MDHAHRYSDLMVNNGQQQPTHFRAVPNYELRHHSYGLDYCSKYAVFQTTGGMDREVESYRWTERIGDRGLLWLGDGLRNQADNRFHEGGPDRCQAIAGLAKQP